MVLSNTAANGQELVADAHLLPAAGVGEREGAAIKSYVASDPNPTAMIMALLAAGVGETKGTAMKSYIVLGLRHEPHGPNPTATIVVAETQVGMRPSPVVAAFSSRGPNMVTPEILKPDMIVPG